MGVMVGIASSLWDNPQRCFRFGAKKESPDVLKEKRTRFLDRFVHESLTSFLDRSEDDTYVVVRNPDLSPGQIQKGLKAIEEFADSRCDYDCSAGDNEYYCTEMAIAFLKAATGESPMFEIPFPGGFSQYSIDWVV